MINTQLKEELFKAYNFYCSIEGCLNKATDLHHRLIQSKDNKDKFPLFIHSPFNIFPVCRSCHDNGKGGKIKEEVALIFEDHLRSLLFAGERQQQEYLAKTGQYKPRIKSI